MIGPCGNYSIWCCNPFHFFIKFIEAEPMQCLRYSDEINRLVLQCSILCRLDSIFDVALLFGMLDLLMADIGSIYFCKIPAQRNSGLTIAGAAVPCKRF